MKAAIAISLALSLGSMTPLAEGSGRDAKLAAARVAHISTNCPVGMRAQRQIGEGMLAFSDNRYKGVAQRLHLTLNNPEFREIVGVQITVHGLNSKGRLSQAQTAPADSSEIEKIIDLKLKIDGKSDTSTDLFLPAFTSVRSIDLNSINYAGGSTWHSSILHGCHVFPDATMLISSR
jgi:hypothetical protein